MVSKKVLNKRLLVSIQESLKKYSRTKVAEIMKGIEMNFSGKLKSDVNIKVKLPKEKFTVTLETDFWIRWTSILKTWKNTRKKKPETEIL